MVTVSTRLRRASVSLAVLALGFVSSLAQAQLSLPEKRLQPDDGTRGTGEYGMAVSLLGGRAVVGSPGLWGYVYVYEQSGSQWILRQRLETPHWDPERGTGVGHVVVQDENSILASDASYGFVAYYERNPSTGLFRATALLNGAPSGNGTFGSSLALSGCVVLVGTVGPYSGGIQRGMVHVYNRCPSGALKYTGTIYPPSGSTGDSFSYSLALSGNELIVGSPNDGAGGAGAAYYYVFDGSKFVYRQKIVSTQPAAGNRFGEGVAFRNGMAVIGSPGKPDSGQAEIFKRTGSTWASIGSVVPAFSDGSWSGFGAKIVVTPDYVGIGTRPSRKSPYDQTPPNVNSSLFFYKRTGDTLTLLTHQKAPAAPYNTGYATDFAIAGRGLIVGEPDGIYFPLYNDFGGRAFIYQLPQ